MEKSLDDYIYEFIYELPYWAKYLSLKLLEKKEISENELVEAYKFFLEDESLSEKKEDRAELSMQIVKHDGLESKSDLQFTGLEKVIGVNALVENEKLEFSPTLTIVYGGNGSGKTGYIRLLKRAFFSRAPEEIMSDVNIDEIKEISATFKFSSGEETYSLNYPQDKSSAEFTQFAVFDGKSVIIHLDERNKFEFKPAGLEFFSSLTYVYKRIEAKLDNDIQIRHSRKEYSALFDGDSVIKEAVNNLSSDTDIQELNKLLPNEDVDIKLKTLEDKKAQLIVLKKDKEITSLTEIQTLLRALKSSIEGNNKYFSQDAIKEVKGRITYYVEKLALANKEGITNLQTDKLKSVGTAEWKSFIESAEKVAKQEDYNYPSDDSICIFCHQPLKEDSHSLIHNYWKYLKSKSEQDKKDAKDWLEKAIGAYNRLSFDLISDEGILKKWLTDNYGKEVEKLIKDISSQKELFDSILLDLKDLNLDDRSELMVDVSVIDTIDKNIEEQINKLKLQEPIKELESINQSITLLNHQQKLSQHISSIAEYINNLKWTEKATQCKRKLLTTKVTIKEKELSDRFFNQDYIEAFSNECKSMEGSFGVEVNHTGTAGTSYRQLKLKGHNPSAILSEGEQKVISLADFLSETKLSQINKGIIFDDPVNSLDEERKSIIAGRLVKESQTRQVIVFTHDLVFVSFLISACEENNVNNSCHWIEKLDGKPGKIWLDNTPSFEKAYRKSGKAQDYYNKALSATSAQEREDFIKAGFGALRSSYESFVIFELFEGVVQRFTDRVSIMALKNVIFTNDLKNEIIDNFEKCCGFMEGHSHSDNYASVKPQPKDLIEQIEVFNALKKNLKDSKPKT